MTPQEAIQLLDNAVSQMNLNREGHVKMQQAVQVIRQALNKQEAEEEDGGTS